MVPLVTQKGILYQKIRKVKMEPESRCGLAECVQVCEGADMPDRRLVECLEACNQVASDMAWIPEVAAWIFVPLAVAIGAWAFFKSAPG